MLFHDLVAHCKAYARTPGLGAALVEFLFHQRNFVLRNTGTKVTDLHHVVLLLTAHRDMDALAAAAVLGGVVQQVAEDLAEAVGAHAHTIELIESGLRTPSMLILARMARTLRCRLGDLIDEEAST